jgi:hypothetical protein
MLHQQERHPCVRRQLLQQRRESFQPARRSSDTYDWKTPDISSGKSTRFCFFAASWHTFTLPARSLIASVHQKQDTMWDEQGKLLGEYRMDHGTGIQRVWFENGILQSEQSFVNGKAAGPGRRWLQDSHNYCSWHSMRCFLQHR